MKTHKNILFKNKSFDAVILAGGKGTRIKKFLKDRPKPLANIGEYYFLEICRRPPGDLYTKFVTLATGVNIPLIILNSFTDYDYPTSELRRNQKENHHEKNRNTSG